MDTVRIYYTPQENTKKYYKLELDNYNQPSGIVNEVYIKEEDFKQLRGHYIYENYEDALIRAMD